jgi:uncharacterized membrane protein YcaP (DUF421 family)
MGKRQLGELQPFEFVIALAVADLACLPMQEVSIPLQYGLAPVFTIFLLHFIVTFVSVKSVKFRKLLNGKPVIVINSGGIDSRAMKSLNMNVNDLLESIRGAGYFSVEQIAFAIVETNGKLSVLPKDGAQAPVSIPLTLITDGKLLSANIAISDTGESEISEILKAQGLNPKNVVLMTAENGRYFIQPEGKPFVTLNRL